MLTFGKICEIFYLYTVDRFKPMKHRNTSDFPVGDRDPSRDVERLNATNYREYHGKVIKLSFLCVCFDIF